eukprot:TRINITY_DN31953_c0_g1_i1.p1 TRINITY_DN31953_c0_g1~~TRINITY_DN31953_c0_g1_i1.p1  ORF type:complete len:797 (+),score=174.62 TRINITY_DN31953_c0_g1_i1:97-2487(+)
MDREPVGDEADEVLYDADQAPAPGGDGDPCDDSRWTQGIPLASVMHAVALPLWQQAPEAVVADLLSETEVAHDITPYASTSADYAELLRVAGQAALTDSPANGLLNPESEAACAIATLCAAAVGAGLSSSQWRDHAAELAALGAARTLLGVALAVAGELSGGLQKATDAQRASVSRVLRLSAAAVCAIGAAVPGAHGVDKQLQRPALRASLSLLRGISFGRLPAKKMLHLTLFLVTAAAGPDDPTPKRWRQGVPRPSGRWVGDGTVEQYIGSVLHSGETGCAPLAHLSADLLRSLYYHYWHDAVSRRSRGQPARASDLFGGQPPPPFRGVPRPVCEALAVYAAALAAGVQRARGASAAPAAQAASPHASGRPSTSGRSPRKPPSSAASTGDPECLQAAALARLVNAAADAAPPDFSLTPEFPPRWDAHLQPNGETWRCGSAPPAVPGQHATAPSLQHVQQRAEAPSELIYTALLTAGMDNVVLSLLKVFLSALPVSEGEDAELRCCDVDAPQQGSPAELQRHRSIVARVVVTLLLRIAKELKQGAAPAQAAVFLRAVAESNGVLLLLKYLHINSVSLLSGINGVPEGGWDEALEVPCPLAVSDAEHVPWTDARSCEGLHTLLPCRVALDDGDDGVVMLDRRALLTCIIVLRLLHKLTNRRPQRLCVLLQYKAHVLVRRKLRVAHPLLRLYALKILLGVTPFLGRRWRAQNTRVLSHIHRYLGSGAAEATAACFVSIDPLLPDVGGQTAPQPLEASSLPVPAEQHEREYHLERVALDFDHVDYPEYWTDRSAAPAPA